MRVLLIEDDSVNSLTIRSELADRHQVLVVPSLRDAVGQLSLGSLSPDAIILGTKLPDARSDEARDTLRSLAPQIPIVLRTDDPDENLGDEIDRLAVPVRNEDRRENETILLKSVLYQTTVLHRKVASYKTEILDEIDQVAQRAAGEAAEKAINELVERLGMQDEEGVRMAVRLARGWDAAKGRFVSAIATGLASALLLALGAGVVAMLRNHASK